MPNKLKDMELSSVDMCRRGANQEAHFRLFKSASPETNIFKRFLDWLRENPDEIPEDTIEKDYTTFDQINDNRESEDKLWRYADALTCSLHSIRDDNELGREEKASMMRQSLQQFDAAMGQLIDQLAGSAPRRDEPVMAKSAPEYDMIEEIDSKKA